jgi:nucleotide-binding universal stress UspA family protein
MFELKRILCPTDLSNNSRKAVAFALSLANRYDATAFFLHVVDRPPRDAYDENASAALAEAAIDDDEQEVREHVREAMEMLTADGNEAVPSDRLMYRVASGAITESILGAADDASVDMIVMGSHGRTTIKEFILGSEAERVVKKATCAVLVVKPEGFPYLRD